MESECRTLLYQVWRKIRCNSCCEEWSKFDVFYEWAMAKGYQTGVWIQRADIARPFGPDNCVLRFPKSEPTPTFTQQEKEWADGWNRMVNRIRKHYGMSPLEGTEHGN